MKYLILGFCFWMTSSFHGGHIAEYHYQINGEILEMKFVIEKEDLLHFPLDKNCNHREMTALCTFQYLEKNSSLEINGEKIEMELHESFTQQDHFILLLKSKNKISTVEEISIQNNSFYEFDRKFKNRIVIDLGKFQGSYLLKKKKNLIHLN